MLRYFFFVAVAVLVSFATASAQALAGPESHTGVVTAAELGKLGITDDSGAPHTFSIDDSVMITVNGRPGKLKDLKKGMHVRVITDAQGKVLTVATRDSTKGTKLFDSRTANSLMDASAGG
ncbi:MAG TPA: hypothetical protein VFE24_10975 [Pirellulales bacterium]|jgi:hypothetical protein|nr:hypothetical protein [Pirellulales bacterium]